MLTDLETVMPDVAHVTCCDVGGRPRAVSVMPLSDERVMVAIPPGEVAQLEPTLAESLGDAVLRAVRTSRVIIEPSPATSVFGRSLCTMRCRDGLGRDRGLLIAADRDRMVVVVAAPPSGIVVLRPSGAALFRAALRDAASAVRFEAVIM